MCSPKTKKKERKQKKTKENRNKADFLAVCARRHHHFAQIRAKISERVSRIHLKQKKIKENQQMCSPKTKKNERKQKKTKENRNKADFLAVCARRHHHFAQIRAKISERVSRIHLKQKKIKENQQMCSPKT